MNSPDSEDPSTPATRSAPTHGRQARREARRKAQVARRRRIVRGTAWSVGGLVVALAGGLILTDTVRLRIGAAPGPALAVSATAKSARFAPPVTVPVSTSRCRTPLTPAAPLRVWVAGDSLAWSVGTGLGKHLSNTGIVAETFESRVSSGLANVGFFDWPKRAAAELTRLDPEIVVFVIGTNDWPVPTGPAPTGTTTTAMAGSPSPSTTSTTTAATAWKAKYASLVEQMVTILVGDGTRTVYWVGPPILSDTQKENGAVQVGDLAREVVARHPTVTYVDSHALFADSSGRYTPYVQRADGKRVLVRTDDGVHYTLDGADYIGSVLFDTIERQCGLSSQAVAGHKIPVVETQGSSGSGSSQTSTTSTTAAATSSTTKSSAPTTTTTRSSVPTTTTTKSSAPTTSPTTTPTTTKP